MKKILSSLATIFVVYTVGLIIGLLFLALKWTGKIRVENRENFPRIRKKMIIVSNHPDLLGCMYEIFLLPALLFPYFLLHPLRYSPWFAPDKRNFTDKWYWAWLRPRAIPIERTSKNSRIKETRGLFRVLNVSRILIHFAEGGRTCSGRNHLVSKSRKKKIRTLRDSAGWLTLKTQACVLPVWVENGDEVEGHNPKKLFSWPRFRKGPIIVRLGKPMRFTEQVEGMNASKITDIITLNLLKLADQEPG